MSKEKIAILEKYGAEEIKSYFLVNNYGYTFYVYGDKYDIRFWANCYGVAIDRWSITPSGRKDHGESEEAKAINEAIGVLLKKIENEFNEAGEGL